MIKSWGESNLDKNSYLLSSGIAIAADGDVYIADIHEDRIQHFNGQGGFIQTIGGFGSGDGQFNTPRAVDIAPDGALYVADTKKTTVFKNSHVKTNQKRLIPTKLLS